MLTDEERRVAAQRAREYPSGWGHSYLANVVAKSSDRAMAYLSRKPELFADG